MLKGSFKMEEPAFLPVGTEVSAKYRGAFCEAKVKKVVKAIKIKITLKESGLPLVVTACSDEDVKGHLKIGSTVEVKHPESGQYVSAVICKITDQSSYTVVFDDADENTLRRTQLCLKGEKHFVKTDTLDELPLTNPEHFGTPVLKGSKKKRRSLTAAASSESDSGEESDEPEPRHYWGRLREMVGKVICFQQDDRKKTMTLPALVVQPNADQTDLKTKDHLLVKSFKDSKFYAVHRKDAREFTRDTAMKNEDKALKAVYEKALLYYDAKELPQHWDREDLLGQETDDEDEDEQSSDNEPSEEKDMFVAQLYKFMDDRATPINKGPVIGTRDLNLYRLFRVVHKLGGYNRVTNQMKWRLVYSKLGLPNTANAANQMKTAYKKYLHAFEDFYRKLGSSMGTITRPNRGRMSSSRNIPGFRDRGDRGESSPRSPRGGGATGGGGSAKKTPKEGEAVIEASPAENLEKTPQDPVKPVRTKQADEGVVRSLPLEHPSDSESPSKRRTRTGVEERGKAVVRDTKKTGGGGSGGVTAREEEETASEREEVKVKKRPIRKKLTKTEEAERDEVKRPKDEGKEDADDEEEEEGGEQEEEVSSTQGDGETSSKKYENVEYPPGSKLKIKYGKGKNVKAYEAKVLDCKADGVVMNYLVHYNGWNVRYDEWVRKDRILECVHKADGKRPITTTKPNFPGSKILPMKKKMLTPKAMGPSLKDEKEKLSKSTSPKMSKSSKMPRPTRSTSMENQLAHGLSPRKRLRRLSGYTETSEGRSHLSGESSDSDESGDSENDLEEMGGPDEEDEQVLPPGGDLPLMPPVAQDDDPEHDPRESAFDIMKELQADIEFDKASQDSLERDLNIKIPHKTKAEKSDSEEDMDINTILSCLKDEYKFPSSESESVKSEGPDKQRMGRGKTKTKGELKAKPDLSKLQKPEGLKTRAEAKPKVEAVKPKTETPLKTSSPEQTKIKTESVKIKTELHKARVDLTRTRIDPGVAKLRPDPPISRKEVTKSKPEPTATKTKPEFAKLKELNIEQTDKAPVSEKDEVPFSPEGTSTLSRNTDTEKVPKATEKPTSSGDEQVAERPRGRRKKETDDEKIVESPSRVRSKGRGKRRLDKDETQDSEEEPIKKKTRQKPSRKRKSESESDDKSAPPRLTSSDEGKEDTVVKGQQLQQQQEQEDENEWMNAPELTATPKLELEAMDDKDSDTADQPAPSLSPVHLRSSSLRGLSGSSPDQQPASSKLVPENLEDMEEQDQEEVEEGEEDEAVALPKAFTSTVENTPPQTPEHASQTPRHDNASEACSTRSEMEANLEVEGYLEGALPPGGESPGLYDPSQLSAASDDEEGGGLSQAKLGEVEASVAASLGTMQALVKRKAAEESAAAAVAAVAAVAGAMHQPERQQQQTQSGGGSSSSHNQQQQPSLPKRRRGHKKTSLKIKEAIAASRRNISDYDDEDSKDAIGTGKMPIVPNLCFPALSKPMEYPTGPSKYNFIEQLEEGKYLTGESRVNFLLGKISNLRSIYLGLKAEVASIDRRRKKFRKKQRIAQETAAQSLIVLEQSVS